jgi:energy-coupling factor transporter ATP-binding protein EcfA2
MKAIRLQRFRAFEDSGWIEFKPITLLFGYNSAGKSSILQALLMLKQSIKNMADEVPFVFSSDKGVDLGTFEDVVHKHNIDHENPMIISLKVDIEKDVLDKLRIDGRCVREEQQEYITDYSFDDVELSETEFSIDISYNQKRRFIAVKGFKITDCETGRIILGMKKKGVSETEKPEYYSDYMDVRNKKVPVVWFNFIPVIKPEPGFEAISKVSESIRKRISFSLDRMVNIGPLREKPERMMLFAGEKPASVGTKGEDTFKLLFNDKHSASSMELEEKLNKYLKKYNYLFEWIMLRSNLGQFMLKDISTGILVNIVDVGFGISQVLPIAVQLYVTGRQQFLLIEQPEIHLHSKAQADIADLMIDAISYGNKTIVLETHSENLLLRLRRRVAEGEIINSENVAIYYVEQKDSISRVYKMKLNQLGDIENMPDDFKKFFQDDYNDVMNIHTAKGRRLADLNETRE